MKKHMINFIIIMIVLYSGIVLGMGIFQRALLYLPDKSIGTPEQYGLSGFTEKFIKTANDVSIQTWYKPAQKGMPTIIYCHGNASHIGNRAGIFSALSGKGFGVLAVSYRGYGKSGGSPSEDGLYADARAAVAYALNDKKIPPEKIIIFGESLGTGVAVQMAGEYRVGGLILQAPYTSISDRASEIYWFIPVKLILMDDFDSIGKINRVLSPLLIFHGAQDLTIPISHGKKLFSAANEPKEAVFFPEVGHNNFDSAEIAERVLQFANKYGIIALNE